MAATPVKTTQDNLLPGRFLYAAGPKIQVAEGTLDIGVDKINPGLPGSVPNTYAISGGADAALFAIDPTNGYLIFIDAPDFEAPRDVGDGAGNNTYQVEITQRTATTIASQLLTVRVLDVDERPGTAPQTSVINNREVQVRYVVEADGTQRQLLSIATEFLPIASSGDTVPIVTDASGKALLSVDLHFDKGGLTASGSATPKAAGASLGDMVREIGQHTEAGSASQAALVEGATRFLAGVALEAPILLQTIVPITAFGEGYYRVLDLAGTPADGVGPLTALVIDARGLSGVTVEVDDIGFLALTGDVTLGYQYATGAGAQQVWADDAAQILHLGLGDDIAHAGGGADTIYGGSGNDRLHGDAGNDLFIGGPGNDWIDGGADLDTVRLGGKRSDYIIRVEEGHIVVTARRTEDLVDELGNITPPEGSDRIANVEVLNFQGAGLDTSVRGKLLSMVEAVEDRVATRVELDGWEAALASGTTLLDISTTLLAQRSDIDGLSDYDFIQLLHENGVGRRADGKEMSQWTYLQSMSTRAELVIDFAESAVMFQYARFAGASTYIADSEIGSLVRMYDALFDRAPDAGGLNYWIGAFENGHTLATIADTFVSAAEGGIDVMGSAEFVAHLYQAGLERSASAGEVAAWAGLIDDGTLKRGDVLLGIADSAEMTALVGVMSTSLELT